eukprot:gene9817-10824_t
MESLEGLIFSSQSEMSALARNTREKLELQKHVLSLDKEKAYTKRFHEVNIQVMTNKFNKAKEKIRRCKTAYSYHGGADKYNDSPKLSRRQVSSPFAAEGDNSIAQRNIKTGSLIKNRIKSLSSPIGGFSHSLQTNQIDEEHPSIHPTRLHEKLDMKRLSLRGNPNCGRDFTRDCCAGRERIGQRTKERCQSQRSFSSKRDEDGEHETVKNSRSNISFDRKRVGTTLDGHNAPNTGKLNDSDGNKKKPMLRTISLSDNGRLEKRHKELKNVLKTTSFPSSQLSQSMPCTPTNKKEFKQILNDVCQKQQVENEDSGGLETTDDVFGCDNKDNKERQTRQRAYTVMPAAMSNYSTSQQQRPRQQRKLKKRSKSFFDMAPLRVDEAMDLSLNKSMLMADFISKNPSPTAKTDGIVEATVCNKSIHGRNSMASDGSLCFEEACYENEWARNLSQKESDNLVNVIDIDVNNNESDCPLSPYDATNQDAVFKEAHSKPRPKTAMGMTKTTRDQVEANEGQNATEAAPDEVDNGPVDFPKRKTLGDLFEEVKYCRYLRRPTYVEDETLTDANFSEYTQLFKNISLLNNQKLLRQNESPQ